MISPEEVRQFSIDLGVPLAQIEKDYVMGWLLWGISRNQFLDESLILKGGSCLRKMYFEDTRFSDDLDFTTRREIPPAAFQEAITGALKEVEHACGVDFDYERTTVKEKGTPIKDSKALDGRVYFRGFAGDASLTFRVKFDISPYEKIVLPVQRHSVIHNYADADLCASKIYSYSLEEVMAEKLRSWIQRTRARDLFDVVKIIESKAVPVSRRNILSSFFQKTLFKDIPNIGKEELLIEDKFQSISSNWLSTIVCPSNAMMVAGNAIRLFRDFINALFQPEIISAVGIGAMPRPEFLGRIPAAVREAIIEAGKTRQLIRMKYKSIDRTIEPYSFRYRVVKGGYGAEYFYGFDRTRGNTIKSFFLHQVQAVSILPDEYLPRWTVEF